jgi:glycosyltransferase involved in cell wall biosynthesis
MQRTSVVNNEAGALMNDIAVVIPTYRAKESILSVIVQIGAEVGRIYVVDDCCPDRSGDYVTAHCGDPRVTVIRHETNQGVGGATLTGMKAAVSDGASVIVKIDADGQMDPALIPFFANPILSGDADYTKGNRFFNAASLAAMPRIRLFGNAVLSIMSKFSTGYWHMFDPANGYVAISARIVELLPVERIAKRFFFETDMLYYLGLLRAVVVDVPIVSHYGDEKSNLKIKSILWPFVSAHIVRFFRRIALNYFIRDFSFGSLCLIVGVPLFLFGLIYGLANWISHAAQGTATPTGVIMVAALTLLFGMQLLLFFFNADIGAEPRHPLHRLLDKRTIQPLKQFAENQPPPA